jgi:polyphosphate kinase 2 (PPK2 family)
MTDDQDKYDRAVAARIEAQIADSFDEELEMEMDDQRLRRLLDGEALDEGEAAGLFDRQAYFKELFRLQRELIKLQDWVVNQKLKVVVIFECRDAAC